MKKTFYPFFCVLLVLTIMTGCSQRKIKSSTAAFPSLEYDIADVMKWDTSKYTNLVFQFFSPSVEEDAPWQLICYGWQRPDSGTVISSPDYDKLRISTTQDSTQYVSDSVIAGNNIVPLRLLQLYASAVHAADTNAKTLIFIPYDNNPEFNNYILYRIKVLSPDPANGQYLHLDPTKVSDELQPYLKVDPKDGSTYLQLNPCPPANMQLSYINHSNTYGFTIDDAGLVRGMVIADAYSNTTLETRPAIG
jgi:hypothetical protein